MKKSELKEVIKGVLRKKLNEISKKGSEKYKYGIVSGFDRGEPVVDVVGYGRMKLSTLKAEAVRSLANLKKELEAGNSENVLYYLDPDGILSLFVRALVDAKAQLNDKKRVGEGVTTPDQVADALSATKASNPNDAKKIADLETKKNKIQIDIENLKGKMAKMITPIQNQLSRKEGELARINSELRRIKSKSGIQ